MKSGKRFLAGALCLSVMTTSGMTMTAYASTLDTVKQEIQNAEYKTKAELQAMGFETSNAGTSTYGLLTWEGKDGAAAFEDLPIASKKVQKALPAYVALRTNTMTYTPEWEFALYKGSVYVKHHEAEEEWRVCPMPDGLKGTLIGISADSNQMLATDEDGWFYRLNNLYNDCSEWKWATNWGEFFGLNPWYKMPNNQEGMWCYSRIDDDIDDTYTDSDGRRHKVGDQSCSTAFFVDPDDHGNIIYIDPWAHADESHEVATPYSGRFQIKSMSTSASTLFIVNEYGDLYTRNYDYDSTADPLFFKYTWRSYSDEEYNFKHEVEQYSRFVDWLRYTFPEIKLPSPYWVQQPKIDGTITSAISIESTWEAGMENRVLKVEGINAKGQTGYWTKYVNDEEWTFVVTNMELQGEVLQNSLEDTSQKDLADPSGLTYEGLLDNGAVLRVADFAYNDTRHDATITVDGVTVPCVIFSEYGSLGTATTMQIFEHSSGLNEEARFYNACLVLSEDDYATLSSTTNGKKFLKNYMNNDTIKEISMQATINEISLGYANPYQGILRLGQYQLDRVD